MKITWLNESYGEKETGLALSRSAVESQLISVKIKYRNTPDTNTHSDKPASFEDCSGNSPGRRDAQGAAAHPAHHVRAAAVAVAHHGHRSPSAADSRHRHAAGTWDDRRRRGVHFRRRRPEAADAGHSWVGDRGQPEQCRLIEGYGTDSVQNPYSRDMCAQR